MGNRAVISFSTAGNSLGIYLHWNGGIESVQAFLDYAKEAGIRDGSDKQYCLARLCQIIGNFIGGTTSVGIGLLANLDKDNGDNGLYILNDKLEIVVRKYAPPGAGLTVPASRREHYEGVLAECREKNRGFFEEA